MRSQLILQCNVKAALHDVLFFYYNAIRDQSIDDKHFFSFHLSVFAQRDFDVLIRELFGHQSALNTLVGPDYQKYTHDKNTTDDMHLRMLQFIFPYEFECQLLKTKSFFNCLLAAVSNYDISNHRAVIRDLYTEVSKIKPDHQLVFFTPDGPLFFAVAEHLLVSFVRSDMLRANWNVLEHFTVRQKCSLIAAQDIRAFGMNARLIDLIDSEHARLREIAAAPEEEACLRKVGHRIMDRKTVIDVPDGLQPLHPRFYVFSQMLERGSQMP
jgi:hypothetical protein